ncbi:MAG: lysine--tRNA ligase [Candidatus Diapherotrites archaeon]|nr:lysine--tRNA ligase [Candidatus Diapherotrites archaeon]
MENLEKEQKDVKFWAESIAETIANREKFHFTNEKVPKLKKWSVKSSSSLSGILHIGRLSDLIRSEAVFNALKERGFPVEFIYVTEDMDPLRKIPAGVPASFEEYIGTAVSDIPDPWGCHKSYDKHHLEEFLKVINEFLSTKPQIFSMREEYKKGNFAKDIVEIVKNSKQIVSIIDQFKEKDEASSESWLPWRPICDNCGKLQTTEVVGVEGTKVEYICKDYEFETKVAKGCGHHGFSDVSKSNGKLAWKSEWAMQWKRWNVCSEGAGKEYESKNSAFWINAEIAEKVLHFPMPEPIFYEHLIIDGVKMSASLGNIVYPKDWLECSRPETLRLLYLKRLMKTRSFSWSEVLALELELDRLALAVQEKKGDEKDQQNNVKLLHFVSLQNRKIVPLKVDYSMALMLAQLFPDVKDSFEKLKEMKLLAGKESKEEIFSIKERLNLALAFAEKHATLEQRIAFVENLDLSKISIVPEIKSLFPAIAKEFMAAESADEIQSFVFNIAKENNVQQQSLFTTLYSVLIGKIQGPKIGGLVFALGKDKCAKRLLEL